MKIGMSLKLIETLLCLAILVLPQKAFSQSNNPTQQANRQVFIVEDARHFTGIGLGLIGAPFHFNSGDWARVGLTAGGTALLFALDRPTKDFALRNQTRLNDDLFNLDSYQGNYYSLYLSLGIYGAGALAGNSKIRKMGLYATEAFLYSGAITGVLKVLIGRRRPYAGESPFFFKPFQLSGSTYKALPSGHTTVSFAVSTALAKSLENRYWKVFWYGTAGLVGASRIYHNKHWLSDVFLAAMVGYSVGTFIVNSGRQSKNRKDVYKLSVFPSVNGGGVCIVF